MKIEKICEYLSEIGIIEYENINIFLDIYTKLNNAKNSDKIIDTLAIYINNNYIKNNQLKKLSQSIISSFNNYQLILKYRILNNMKNILYSKIHTKYIIFFLNLSFYLLRKKKNSSKINLSNKKKKSLKKIIKKKENKLEDDNNENKNNHDSELISSDDERECTFTPKINKNFKGYKKPKNNIESQIYYSPAFNISSKFPINNYQNYNINHINDNSYTDNNYSNYSNFNNYNISNETKSNRSYNILDNNHIINNDYLLLGLNEYNNNYYSNNSNSFYSSNNSRLMQSNINYNNILQMNAQNSLMKNYNNQNIQNLNIYNNNRKDEFFNKELEHIQKVKDKIQNMKIEKLNKIKEECTFEPKINTNYKSFYNKNKELENNNTIMNNRNIYQEQLRQIDPNIQFKGQKSLNMNNLNNQKIIQLKKKEPLEIIQENNNLNQNSLIIKKKKENKKRSYSEKKKGIKIIEDLSLAKKRRTDKTKRLMKERNFTPKIRKSDKYKEKVTMSFQDRVLKSIELKNKYKKGKNNDIINKNEDILSPDEMVRFIDKNNNENNKDNNRKISEIKDDELYKKVNNTEYNNENINKENKKDSNNYSFSNDINNRKEIEKNKMILINRIKDEHKIGFKVRKDDEDIKEKEEIELNIVKNEKKK